MTEFCTNCLNLKCPRCNRTKIGKLQTQIQKARDCSCAKCDCDLFIDVTHEGSFR